jgi:leader peptidase (prepilin peptidase)/N-methyltransferase
MISLIIYLVTFLCFLFLAIEDYKRKEISASLAIALVLINIIYTLAVFLTNSSKLILLCNINFCNNPYSSLLGALVLGLFSSLIVLFTKEKGMGMGDVFLFVIMGLVVGYEYVLLALSITVFFALLFSVIKNHGIKLRSQIALVPFIFLGTYIVFFLKIFL